MGRRTAEDPYGDDQTQESPRGVAELLGLGSENDAEKVSLQNDEFAQVDATTAPKLLEDPDDGFKAHCEECNAGIEWSGRGRRPRFCIDHKARTSSAARASTNRGTGRRSSKREAELEQLAHDIAKEIAIVGKLSSRSLPVFGVSMVKRANAAANVCIHYARKYPAVFDALTTVAEIGPGIEAGEIIAEWGTAFLVDINRVSPDAMLAQMLGVTATYLEVYPDAAADAEASRPSSNGQDYANVNGRLVPQFVPVS